MNLPVIRLVVGILCVTAALAIPLRMAVRHMGWEETWAVLRILALIFSLVGLALADLWLLGGL